jgi:hypothetical protein
VGYTSKSKSYLQIVIVFGYFAWALYMLQALRDTLCKQANNIEYIELLDFERENLWQEQKEQIQPEDDQQII